MIGQTISHYRITEKLSGGGMGHRGRLRQRMIRQKPLPTEEILEIGSLKSEAVVGGIVKGLERLNFPGMN